MTAAGLKLVRSTGFAHADPEGQRLRSATEHLRLLRNAIDNSGDIILLIDRSRMRFVYVNETACAMLGYSRDEMLAMGPQDVLPVPRAELERIYDELIATPDVASSMRSHYRCKDGSLLPFEASRRLLRSGDSWIVVAISRDVRDRLASERALRLAEAKFRAIFENAVDGIFQLTREGRVLAANDAMRRILGYDSGEEMVEALSDVSHALYADPADRERLFRALDAEGEVRGFETRYRRKDGSAVWVSLGVSLHGDAEGGESVFGVMQDITERKAQQEKIERLGRVYAVLSGIDAVIMRERNRETLFREVCRIARQAGGFCAAWAGLVDPAARRIVPIAWEGLEDWYMKRMPMSLEGEEAARSFSAQAILRGEPVVAEDMATDPLVLLREEAASCGFHSLTILPVSVGGAPAGVMAFYAAEIGFFDEDEVTLLRELARNVGFALDSIAKSERLDYLAFYDSLTGLPNRTLFHDRLTRGLHRRMGEEGGVALVLFDLERLQRVNDTLGRAAGDELLRQVAARLQRASDSAARIGVDVYAITLRSSRNAAEVSRAVELIVQDCFRESFRVGGQDLAAACRIGIALHPADGGDADTLLRNAEAALRRSKASGERVVFYAAEMNARVAEALAMENKLRRALDRDEFVLHYQPKVELAGGRIVGVEALIRWQDPEQGLVPPGRFIPVLEESGLIAEVGAWAIGRALRDTGEWRAQRLAMPQVAVNVSAIQLQRREFVDTVIDVVSRAGGAPGLLELEITESLLMHDVEQGIHKLSVLRDRGISISMDDFGTGYSSLSYLARLPIDKVKVDRSFVTGIVDSAESAAIVEGIIALVHSLKHKVVAEGVETAAQAARLAALGCDQGQGYYYARPMPAPAIAELMRSGCRLPKG